MTSLVFRNRFEFAHAPADWKPVNVALDWSGNSLLLMVEGKGSSPSFTDLEAWLRWHRTPPKAHHIVYWAGGTPETLRLEQGSWVNAEEVGRLYMTKTAARLPLLPLAGFPGGHQVVYIPQPICDAIRSAVARPPARRLKA